MGIGGAQEGRGGGKGRGEAELMRGEEGRMGRAGGRGGIISRSPLSVSTNRIMYINIRKQTLYI